MNGHGQAHPKVHACVRRSSDDGGGGSVAKREAHEETELLFLFWLRSALTAESRIALWCGVVFIGTGGSQGIRRQGYSFLWVRTNKVPEPECEKRREGGAGQPKHC